MAAGSSKPIHTVKDTMRIHEAISVKLYYEVIHPRKGYQYIGWSHVVPYRLLWFWANLRKQRRLEYKSDITIVLWVPHEGDA